jgi:glutamate dehydrogenase (NAD(P)+)
MKRYLEAMRPMLLSCWATGDDLGVSQDLLDELAVEVGLQSTAHAVLARTDDPEAALTRIRESFRQDADGLLLGDAIGGYGVAQATLAAMEHVGLDPDETRAVVQGFGSIGGGTARYLAAAGVTVVGVADANGLISNPDGLDVERLLLTRDSLGTIDRSQLGAADREAPRENWLSLDAELLVPAATSYAIDEGNCDSVFARLMVEAANVAVVRAAEQRLADRGVTVVPDFVANVGTNAWWYWTLFGDLEPDREEAFAKVGQTLQSITREMFERAERSKVLPRAAAELMALERLEAYDRARDHKIGSAGGRNH